MSIISRRISILYVVGLAMSILYDEWTALLMQRSRYDKSVIAIDKTVIIKCSERVIFIRNTAQLDVEERPFWE